MGSIKRGAIVTRRRAGTMAAVALLALMPGCAAPSGELKGSESALAESYSSLDGDPRGAPPMSAHSALPSTIFRPPRGSAISTSVVCSTASPSHPSHARGIASVTSEIVTALVVSSTSMS